MKPALASRLKFDPPIGRMPTLQFCRPAELRIDPAYQRDVGNDQSRTLIRRIASQWNWDLCQPLVVARRTDFVERLFVIDGAAPARGGADPRRHRPTEVVAARLAAEHFLRGFAASRESLP